MNQITEKIWIGNYLDAADRDALGKAGIVSIVCLDGCLAKAKAADLGVQRIEVVELIDGTGNSPENFLHAVRILKELAGKHPPVLVHCHAGKSRSAAVVCKYFMREEGNTLGQAMKRITAKRRVMIDAGLQEALDFK